MSVKDRFSVIILCYRHFQYLFQAIDSVFKQDYQDIELIISDDCSDSFPEKEIKEYINIHKTKQITNVIIRQQKQNGGTVKHLNGAIQECTGEYIIALAGDDVLFDETVLTSYVNGFLKAPNDCYIEMAQTAMYDNELDKLEDYYLKIPVQKAIEKTMTDTSDLLSLLIEKGACLPSTSTCFKNIFFKKFGLFDEQYVLVEDYPMHVRLAKEGWKIHYENFVAIKHRDGGISHGQIDASSRSAKLYFEDTKKMIEQIILPEIEKLPKEERSKKRRQKKKDVLWIDYHLAKAEKNIFKICCIALSNLSVFFPIFLGRMWNWAYKWHLKMLYVTLIMWLFIPTISNMFEVFFHLDEGSMVLPLYYLSFVMALWWLVSFIIWGANKIIWAIMRLPSEIYAIG